MKFFNFLAGFFQDQSSGNENGGSRKAIALFVLLFFLSDIVNAAITGITVDKTVTYCVVGLIAWTLGAITTETFLQYLGRSKENSNNENENKNV